MISANKIFLFLILVLLGRTALLAQDSFEDQFKLAEKLYKDEKYFDAVTEFKRLLFFDNSERYSYDANRLIGLSYKGGGKLSDALLYITNAEIHASTLDEIYDCRIEIVKINILRRTTFKALALLDLLANDSRFNQKIDKINYWRGWAYIFADDWEKASISFSEIEPQHQLALLCDSLANDLYDPTLAKALSIIPGAGQFYTGEYVSGIISIGWNVLWGYLTINAFIEDRVFDGFVIGTLLWWRFYSGNLQNAEKFAVEKNLVKSNQTLRYLQDNYDGSKP